ncbi:MAG TPA: phosphate ABC transporter permease subunit PstC [Actinomycetota bacterium]|nr:phosphate ABC transporter permease subunit PstC [Actinomycetota bacterium]
MELDGDGNPRRLTGTLELADLRGDRSRHRREQVVRGAFGAAAAVSVLVSAAIVYSLFGEALNFVSQIELSQLWERGWFPRRGLFDVHTILVGTLVVTGIGMLFAIPLGLGAAIYLAEYARPRVRKLVKPALEVIGGIPSVVIGFFALTFLSPSIVQRLNDSSTIFNMAAAGLGVGILVTPLIATIAEDALRAVPMSLREGSYALGARKRVVTLRTVLPAAVSGIVAALIVGFSRAFGETMVVAIASGATGGSLLTFDPFGPGQTMTAAMASLAIGSDQVQGDAAAFQSLFFVGVVLFFLTLALNLVSERFVRRVRKRY